MNPDRDDDDNGGKPDTSGTAETEAEDAGHTHLKAGSF